MSSFQLQCHNYTLAQAVRALGALRNRLVDLEICIAFDVCNAGVTDCYYMQLEFKLDLNMY